MNAARSGAWKSRSQCPNDCSQKGGRPLSGPTEAARREALNLLRLIGELEWDFQSTVKLSLVSETAILAALANAQRALARILATPD